MFKNPMAVGKKLFLNPVFKNVGLLYYLLDGSSKMKVARVIGDFDDTACLFEAVPPLMVGRSIPVIEQAMSTLSVISFVPGSTGS